MMDDLETRLAEFSGKRLAVVCVGNVMRADDGFGLAVAARLRSDLGDEAEEAAVFHAGAVPENVLPKVAERKPEVVVFVDAADWGGEPGELRLVAGEELAESDFSTHSAPLGASMAFLREACGAQSVLLAAQPKSTALGGVMSVEVARAAERAASLLQPFV